MEAQTYSTRVGASGDHNHTSRASRPDGAMWPPLSCHVQPPGRHASSSQHVKTRETFCWWMPSGVLRAAPAPYLFTPLAGARHYQPTWVAKVVEPFALRLRWGGQGARHARGQTQPARLSGVCRPTTKAAVSGPSCCRELTNRPAAPPNPLSLPRHTHGVPRGVHVWTAFPAPTSQAPSTAAYDKALRATNCLGILLRAHPGYAP